MNIVFFATFSVRVLFATEILDLDTTGFGVLMAADGGGGRRMVFAKNVVNRDDALAPAQVASISTASCIC
jgi:hypothetical protein